MHLLLRRRRPAALNGVAIAVAPADAAHYASGVQFATQNLAKLVVPIVGGRLIDATDLMFGFDAALLVTCGSPAPFSIAALRAARRARPAPTRTARRAGTAGFLVHVELAGVRSAPRLGVSEKEQAIPESKLFQGLFDSANFLNVSVAQCALRK